MANKAKVTVQPGTLELFITREFEAPVDLVYRAYTDPELFQRWIGPRGLTTSITEMDNRAGGSWRYVQRDEAGNEFGFHGVNHLVEPLKRIVQTWEWEGLPGHVSLQTAEFEDLPGGRSRVTAQAVFQSLEDRDGMVNSGMERGVQEGFERLDELLAERQKEPVR